MIVAGKNEVPALLLNGVDVMLESWADYILVYPHTLDKERFVTSLQAALDINPYFSGRKYSKDGVQTFVTGGNEGVLLETQQFNVELPSRFYENDYHGYDLLCGKDFRAGHRLSRSSFKHPLFQIRLSEFEGASVLGLSVWHSLSDGSTFFNFIRLLSRLYMGLETESHTPDFARIGKGRGADVTSLLVDVWDTPTGPEKSPLFSEATFVLNEASVARIVGGFDCVGFMRYDYIIADAWKYISAGLALDADDTVSLYPVYDARQLTTVGPNYVGNLLCYPSIHLSTSDIATIKLDMLSSLIREGAFDLVVKGDELLEEIQEIACFAQRSAKGRYLLKPLYDSMCGAGLLFNNLMAMPYKEFDFGGGPSHIDLPLSDPIRFVQIYPSVANPGCLVVKVNLPEAELILFSEAYTKGLQE